MIERIVKKIPVFELKEILVVIIMFDFRLREAPNGGRGFRFRRVESFVPCGPELASIVVQILEYPCQAIMGHLEIQS